MILPRRTRQSDLDDDELILFDFLWDGDAPPRMLERDTLPLHANTAYTHAIADHDLRPRLLALVRRGLLEIGEWEREVHGVTRVEERCSLTEAGFAAWELERQPDWSRFIASSWEDDLLTVEAASFEIGSRYIEVCRQAGVWGITEGVPTHRIERNTSPLRWKTFEEWHYFDLPAIDFDTPRSPRWDIYKSGRIWWKTVSELQ